MVLLREATKYLMLEAVVSSSKRVSGIRVIFVLQLRILLYHLHVTTSTRFPIMCGFVFRVFRTR